MKAYRIILASRVRIQLLNHIQFLSKVSLPAARRLRSSFKEIIARIGENPFQFPVDPIFEDLNFPYRKALFEKRYKVLFTVSDNVVFIDSVVDCRQNNQSSE